MKKLTKIIFTASLVASLCLVAMPAGAATNLVQNGSFEAPIVNAPQLWDIFVTAAVPNWTIEWMPGSGGGYDPQLELHRGVNGWLPQEGLQYAELDTDWLGPTDSGSGEPASVRIYQDIPTQAGCTYNLSFYFSPRPGTPESDNFLKVFWDGEYKEGMSLPGLSQTDWRLHTMEVVAADSSSRLAFEDHGTANSLGTFLDNISLELVSCPCPPPSPCCNGDIEVENRNTARVSNYVTVTANTGSNVSAGGNATSLFGTANGGSVNGSILTGSAFSKSRVTNVVNTNVTRIRR